MRDLRTWHRALIGDRVLNPESRKLMETPHIGGRARGYGYGWGIETTHRETTVIAHSGGNNVFAANFIRYDDEETLVLFATNTVSDLDTDPIVQELVQRVFPSNE